MVELQDRLVPVVIVGRGGNAIEPDVVPIRQRIEVDEAERD